jgi:predicted TIM-barrel fold metal-dependent hydrolase
MTAPKQRIQESQMCGPGFRQFLIGAEVQSAWSGHDRYFDAHTHFFNAHDVPVSQFISQSLGHELPAPLWPLAAIIGPSVQRAAYKIAPTASEELSHLCTISASTAPPITSEFLDQEIREQQRRSALELARELFRSPVHLHVNESLKQLAPSRRRAYAFGGEPGFSAEFILRFVQRGTVYGQPGEALTGANPAWDEFDRTPEDEHERSLERVGGLLAFCTTLLAPRYHNVRSFIANYNDASHRTVKLSGCFAAMVDFNYWLRMPSSITNMRDQVLLHEQLSLLSGGFVLPLFGYNPWGDLKEHGESIDALKWAVTEHGCVGAKIYPPMGYLPYGNSFKEHQLGTSYHFRPNLKRLDTALEEFHKTCADLGIPVMAHANDTIGRDDGDDTLGGPPGWEEVGKLMAAQNKILNVNLGHFGGTETTSNPSTGWTEQFIALMKSQPSLRIYGDIGHWEAMLKPETAKDVRNWLKPLLSTRIDNRGTTVADRLMYGTDWHMLAKLKNWPQYAEGMYSVFRGDFQMDSMQLARVFGGNALECYGLSEAKRGPNYERLRQVFAAKGLPPPGWMRGPTV